jgi:purine-binding chemotaxis protein CheW
MDPADLPTFADATATPLDAVASETPLDSLPNEASFSQSSEMLALPELANAAMEMPEWESPAVELPMEFPSELPSEFAGELPFAMPEIAMENPFVEPLAETVTASNEEALPSEPSLVAEPAVNLPPWRIERSPASQQNASEVVNYGIVVSLLKNRTREDVVVEHVIPDGAVVVGTKPPARKRGTKLIWEAPNLPSDGRFVVSIKAQPERKIEANGTALFRVFYRTVQEHEATYARSRLLTTLNGPDSLVAGESGTYRLELHNDGAGETGTLRLRVLLPTLVRSLTPVEEIDLGRLVPGERACFELPVIAVEGGEAVTTMIVAEEQSGESRVEQALRVLVRGLQLRASGQLEGVTLQAMPWDLTVSNPGSAPISKVVVQGRVPVGVELIAAEEQGIVDANARSVRWTLAELVPGQARRMTVTLRATFPGDYTLEAETRAASGLHETASTLLHCNPAGASNLLDNLLATGKSQQSNASGSTKTSPAARKSSRPEIVSKLQSDTIAFSLGQTAFALPLANVLEVGRIPTIFPIPNMPDWLLGVANLRGDIVSLVDLSSFLQIESDGNNQDRRVIIARSSGEEIVVGLIVDRLSGIRPSQKEQAPLHAEIAPTIAPYLRGLEESAQRLLLVLDPDKLLLSSQMRQFETF